MTTRMTPEYWQAAQAIAQDLAAAKADMNELKKVVAYLGWLRNREGAVERDRLFTYLNALTRHGEIRSGQTVHHYKTIEQTCQTHLRSLPVDNDDLITLLGWAGRLCPKPPKPSN